MFVSGKVIILLKISLFLGFQFIYLASYPQRPELTRENIIKAYEEVADELSRDPLRPAYHLTPPAGSMGDPSGGIYYNGFYHIFYGLHPFSGEIGGWFWAHAKSKDLLHWEHSEPNLTPAFELGLHNVVSGSTILNTNGEVLAFYSAGRGFYRARFTDQNLSTWIHEGNNPVLTLDNPTLPKFKGRFSMRDPFVFRAEGRTFLIPCADDYAENFVPVPLFEATNPELNDWKFLGNLFTTPKHKRRNLEVPELRKLGNKWIFLASVDAPTDRVHYFLGDLDLENLKFIPESEGVIDYSGHYYAQSTIQDNEGNLYLMSWVPGWDREWLPVYMNEPLKNSSPLWNGCFSIPRQLSVDKDGTLIQKPVAAMEQLRTEHYVSESRELPVRGPFTVYELVKEIRGNQLEIHIELELNTASFAGLNVLCDKEGKGGWYFFWSGDVLHVDGIEVPLEEWKQGDPLQMQIFVDRQLVEAFVNGGRHCVTRKVREENIKGDYLALTRLGGTAKLKSLQAWKLKTIN
jgi:beta-fructofuranosidase